MIKLENRNQFLADWIRIAGEYARDHLGLKIPVGSEIANDQLLAQNFERIPKKRHREIQYSDIFKVPKEFEAGWKFLKKKIESGADLYPHLSRGIKKLAARDPLLMHWRINHFHLGTEADPKHKGLICGGKEIVYAYLDDDYFYAVALLPHDHWEDFELIETIKRNWPMHPNIRSDISLARSFTQEEILELRKHQVNAPVSFADGSLYMGFGQTLAGTSALASMKANGIRAAFGRYQQEFEENFHEYFPDIGINSTEPIVANLLLREDFGFLVSLPHFKKSLNLNIGSIGDLIEELKS